MRKLATTLGAAIAFATLPLLADYTDITWTGGEDANLGNGANWAGGKVPGAGDNAVFAIDAAATLSNDGNFKASSMTFQAGCKKVTIDGEPLAGVEAINNHAASVNHEFKASVSGDAVKMNNTASSSYCVFTGGLTANNVTFAQIGSGQANIRGAWHIKGDWTPVSGNALENGASLTVDGELLNPSDISIYSGCVVTAASIRATTSTYPAYRNEGRLVVKGKIDIGTTGTNKDFSLSRDGSQSATVIAGGIVFNTGCWPWINAQTLVVGEDGIAFDNEHGLLARFSNTTKLALHPRDKTLTLAGANNGKVQRYSITAGTTLEICTTRFESEPAEAATVYVNGSIKTYDSGSTHHSGGMKATGIGRLVFNSASTFPGGLAIGETATVAVNAGCKPGNGTVSVGGGAMLEVAQSAANAGAAAVALGGALSLANDSVLAFNFTSPAMAPTLSVPSLTLPDGGAVKVRVSRDCGEVAFGSGGHVLLSGGALADSDIAKFQLVDKPDWAGRLAVEGGSLVLKRPSGLILILR